MSRDVQQTLAQLADSVLRHPESFGSSALAPVWLGFKTRVMYIKLLRKAYRSIDESAASSPVVHTHRRQLRRATRRHLGRRLAEIRRVAQFDFFERLFSLWHIVHVPFFIMLVLSAIVHVIAVHMTDQHSINLT